MTARTATRPATATIATAIAAVLTLLITGCGPSPMAEAAGTYELDNEAIQADFQQRLDEMEDGPEKMGAQMAAGMISSMQMTITLNEDGTASVDTTMMGQTDQAPATWSISGETVTLTVTPEEGEPDTATGTLEGGTLTLDPPDGENMPIDLVFNKAS